MDLLGRGRVLQKLQDVVLPDHLARGHRHVAADLEGVHVGLADDEGAFAPLQVLGHHLQAAHQVVALLGEGRLDHLGIGGGEVGGRHGLDPLPHQEADLLAVAGVEILAHVLGHVLQIGGGQQVGLLDVVEDPVAAPRIVLEALVALGGGGDGLGGLAEPLGGGAPPQLGLVGPELERAFGHLLRMVEHGVLKLGESGKGVQGIGVQGLVVMHLRLQQAQPDLLARFHHLGHVQRELGGVHGGVGGLSGKVAVFHSGRPPGRARLFRRGRRFAGTGARSCAPVGFPS